MLKRISVTHLRLGMFIDAFCGSWIEHPFWRNAFLLDDAADLKRIVDSGLREVWIDTTKGLDAESGQAKEESDAGLERRLPQAATALEPVSLAREVERAVRICSKARDAVTSMFHQARLGQAITAGDAMPLVEEISASVLRNPAALISLARLKTADDYTYMHSVAVCALMVALARQLDLDPAQSRRAGMAGLLHDVGKMAIPAEVLNKPGKLSDEEFNLIKTHPAEGHAMLRNGADIDAVSLDVVLHHHERMDGSGYPDRLPAEQISLFARMGAVCDVYDAITSDRAYKKAWDPAEALRKMAEWSQGQFDPPIFQAFVKSVGIYPVGSLVKLKSGRLGVVVEQSEKSLLTPTIKVFFSTRANSRIPPELIDLSHHQEGESIVGREDPATWNFPDLVELWSGRAAAPA